MNSSDTPAIARPTNRMADFLRDLEPFFHRAPLIYVDVGAHCGDTFREIAASTFNLNRAHLIEPNPKSFAALGDAVAGSDAARKVTCYNMAMAAAPGRVSLRDADSMSQVIAGDGAGLSAPRRARSSRSRPPVSTQWPRLARSNMSRC